MLTDKKVCVLFLRSKYISWEWSGLAMIYYTKYFKNRSNHLIIIYPPKNKKISVSAYELVSLDKGTCCMWEYTYWDVTLGHVVQVCHLLACVAMWFYLHYPIQEIPIYRFSYIIL